MTTHSFYKNNISFWVNAECALLSEVYKKVNGTTFISKQNKFFHKFETNKLVW